jgi:hypothetical protein
MKTLNFKMVAMLATLLAFGFTACGKKDKKDDAKPTDMSADMGGDMGTEKPKPVEPEKPKVTIDEEFLKSLKAIVADCEFSDGSTYIGKCKGKLNEELVTKVKERKEKKFEDTLDTLAAAIADADRKLQIVTADFISAFGYSITDEGENAAKFNKEAATRFLAAVSEVKDEGLLNRMAITLTHVAMLNELDTGLFGLADAKGKYTQKYIIANAMRFGRMRVFPKIQEYAKNEDKSIVENALGSALNMYKATPDELKIICPWAETFLTSDNDNVFRQAGYLMIRCKGEFIDKLMTEGEKRLKEDKFNREYYFVFREVCFSFMKGAVDEAGLQAQCDRNFKFLEEVAKNKKIDGEFRALALDAIYYQRRDAQTLKVLKKYANDKDPKIKEMVKKDIESLKTHYKVK